MLFDVTGSMGGSLSLRSPTSGEPVSILGPIGEGVLSLQFRRDGEQLVVGGRDGSVRVLSIKK